MSLPQFERPSRGAVRLCDHAFDAARLQDELEALAAEQWSERDYGTNWTDLALFVKDGTSTGKRHPLLDRMPTLKSILTAFPAEPVDMCLASLDAGGRIKEHRDISGGSSANIIRLHVPIVTDPAVEFYVDGDRVIMGAGEVWHLDTTYRHRVANNSAVNRIHLIVDLDATDDMRAMLPAREFRDRLHSAYFYLVCARKGLILAGTRPKQFLDRCTKFFRLRFGRQSVLYSPDDIR